MNTMEIILLVITLFPAIVALMLRGRYYVLVLGLVLINVGGIVIAEKRLSNTSPQYLIASTFNIIFACIIWYLAFKPKADVWAGGKKEGARKLLNVSGWVLVLAILLIITVFAGFIWFVLAGLPSINGA
jgi:uncharacterized membrane protein